MWRRPNIKSETIFNFFRFQEAKPKEGSQPFSNIRVLIFIYTLSHWLESFSTVPATNENDIL
jgi:hypothetical protein